MAHEEGHRTGAAAGAATRSALGEIVAGTFSSENRFSPAGFAKPLLDPALGFLSGFFDKGQQTTEAPSRGGPGQSRHILLPDGRVLNTTSTKTDEEIIADFNTQATADVATRAANTPAPIDEFQKQIDDLFQGSTIAEIDLGGGSTRILFNNPSTGLIEDLGEGMTEEEAARRSQRQMLQSILPFLQLDQQSQQADLQRQGLLFQAQQSSEASLNNLLNLSPRDSLARRAGASNLIGGTLSPEQRDALVAASEEPDALVNRLETEVGRRSSRTLFGEEIPTDFGNLLAATGTSVSDIISSSLRGTIPGTAITQELAGIFAGLTPGSEIPSDLSSRDQLRSGSIQALVTRGILSPEQARELEAAVNFGGVSPEVISSGSTGGSNQRFSSRIVRR